MHRLVITELEKSNNFQVCVLFSFHPSFLWHYLYSRPRHTFEHHSCKIFDERLFSHLDKSCKWQIKLKTPHQIQTLRKSPSTCLSQNLLSSEFMLCCLVVVNHNLCVYIRIFMIYTKWLDIRVARGTTIKLLWFPDLRAVLY